MTTTDYVVQVDGLSVRERTANALILEEVSFRVSPGQILGVVGETGAGKTIAMRSLLGLLPTGLTATGRARFRNGEWMNFEDSRAFRRQAGREVTMVFQNPAAMLDPTIRVRDQLLEGPVHLKLLSKKAATDRAETLLDELGFSEPQRVLRLYPHQLSGGMAQRISITMMMMPQPALIVADEPTSALDAHIRVEVLALLSTIAKAEGSAVILVSHDLGLISRFADRIVVLYAGHIMEEGPTESVVTDPSHPYTAALLACSPSLEVRRRVPLPVIKGTLPSPGAWPPTCVFEPRCPIAAERCKIERPLLRPIGEREVACHFAGVSTHIEIGSGQAIDA